MSIMLKHYSELHETLVSNVILGFLQLLFTFANCSPATPGSHLLPMLVSPTWVGLLHFLSLCLKFPELRSPWITPPSPQAV